MISEGYCELTSQYRKVDFEEWAVAKPNEKPQMIWQNENLISTELCDRLCGIQSLEKTARMN